MNKMIKKITGLVPLNLESLSGSAAEVIRFVYASLSNSSALPDTVHVPTYYSVFIILETRLLEIIQAVYVNIKYTI